MAKAPYYAMFSLPAKPGGDHDYEIHKGHFQEYLPYLRKTSSEQALISTDNNRNWAILMDKGYVGPEADTQGERRITPKKSYSNGLSSVDNQRNEELSRIRVPVEQFFGRLFKLWGLFSKQYKNDNILLNNDFDICVLLTNEQINHSHLTSSDGDFYTAKWKKHLATVEEEKRKRNGQQEKYRTNKRRRLLGDDI